MVPSSARKVRSVTPSFSRTTLLRDRPDFPGGAVETIFIAWSATNPELSTTTTSARYPN